MDTINLDFHDNLAGLCLRHFESLPKTGKPKATEWTILSCVVLESFGNFEVVASGTGSKCIGKDKMSDSGCILNDSHAEVMCRRAFIRYLYSSMRSNEIFKFDSKIHQFRLKEGLKFHFFTSHIPCGDAAIFPKQNEDPGDAVEDDLSHDEIPSKKLKTDPDIFRTGAKCLESDTNQDPRLNGSQYHIVGVVRTKPGRGLRTLSASCSDKLAKWCHLGIQGALLAVLVPNPIYLSSFTIGGGTPFSKEALDRALYERLADVKLLAPYRRSQLVIGQSKLVFKFAKSENKIPCPSSVAWLKTERLDSKQVEVAIEGRRQGLTKKQIKEGAGSLKICKKELFRDFCHVVQKFNIKLKDVDNVASMSYRDAKFLAKPYQEAWNALKISFKVWPEKDESLLKFQIK